MKHAMTRAQQLEQQQEEDAAQHEAQLQQLRQQQADLEAALGQAAQEQAELRQQLAVAEAAGELVVGCLVCCSALQLWHCLLDCALLAGSVICAAARVYSGTSAHSCAGMVASPMWHACHH